MNYSALLITCELTNRKRLKAAFITKPTTFILDCNDTQLILITNETVNSFNIPFKASSQKDNASLSNELLLQLEGNETVWCFNNSVSYLEINFTEQYEICAIETQGILDLNNETLLLSSYVLEAFVSVSPNESIWMFYNGTGNTTVSFSFLSISSAGLT